MDFLWIHDEDVPDEGELMLMRLIVQELDYAGPDRASVLDLRSFNEGDLARSFY